MRVAEKGPVRWAGPALIAIGLMHTVVMILLFHGPYAEMLSSGLFATINETGPHTWAAAFWALIFGFMLMLVGVLLPSQRQPVGKHVALIFTLVVVLGIIVMPTGGFWLGLPVCVGLFLRG